MRKKSDGMVSFTADDLKAQQERGETASDWAKAASLPLPDGSDADDAMDPIDWATTELPRRRAKIHASLRLDADMLEWFRAQGQGYQTKINAILRSYFQQHTG